eukprot:Em0001g2520a
MTAPTIDASIIHFVEGVARNREYFKNVFEDIFVKYDREFDDEEVDFRNSASELDKLFDEGGESCLTGRLHFSTPLSLPSQEETASLCPEEAGKYAEIVASIKREMRFDEDDPQSGYEDNAESGYED